MSYQMKHNKSAFPFKSPVKQNERAIQEGVPGHAPLDLPGASGKMNIGPGRTRRQMSRGNWATDQGGIGHPFMSAVTGMTHKEPTPTPEEYEAQGLNRWGGTDMSI